MGRAFARARLGGIRAVSAGRVICSLRHPDVLLSTSACGVGRLIRNRRSFLNPVSPKRTWNCRVPSPFRGTKKWEKNNILLETIQLHRVCAPVLRPAIPAPRQPSHPICDRRWSPRCPAIFGGELAGAFNGVDRGSARRAVNALAGLRQHERLNAVRLRSSLELTILATGVATCASP
jgi:hypothetical protein